MIVRELSPRSFEQAATGLAAAGAAGRPLRMRGSGTKLGWASAAESPKTEISSARLNAVVEHRAGDLTAVLEAGVPLAMAQEQFAAAGQMLALDPPARRPSPDGRVVGRGATIGGIVASADSGPLCHRYGGARDLVIGITVALSDGTIARAGGNVIKNVAGYDLAKLFAGSFGTLGMILSLNVRLHPLAERTATALGVSEDPEVLGAAARVLAAAPLELDSLDVVWRRGRGGLLARCSGREPIRRAARIAGLMRKAALVEVDVSDDDEHLWCKQRNGQRSWNLAVVRVSGRPSALADVLRATQACGATLVGRAALGTTYVELDPDAIPRLRTMLPDRTPAVVLDAPDGVRDSLDPWGPIDGGALALMRSVKNRFDPAGVCNPGAFVGGI